MNTGVYVFNNKELFKHLNEISGNNAKKEYYLTDIIAIFRKSGLHVGASILPDAREMLGINDRVQLAEATAVLRDRINRMHMLNGVTIIDPNSTYIGPNVKIGADTIVSQETILLVIPLLEKITSLNPITLLKMQRLVTLTKLAQ